MSISHNRPWSIRGWSDGLHHAWRSFGLLRRTGGQDRKRHQRQARETCPPSERRPRRDATEGCGPRDGPRPCAVRRTHHGQHGARNDAESCGVRTGACRSSGVAVSRKGGVSPPKEHGTRSLPGSPFGPGNCHVSLERNLSLRVPNDGPSVSGRSVGCACACRARRRKRPRPDPFGVPHAAGEAPAGHSAGSSCGKLQRRRRPANLCQRAFSAVALQSVPRRRERTPGVGIGARIGRQ